MKTMNTYTFDDLSAKVVEWAKERGIFDEENGSDAVSQYLKFVSEAGELADAINKRNLVDAEDAIGDVLVTLILTSAFIGLDPTACLASAYEVIRQRKGKMVNGVFVKESDL